MPAEPATVEAPHLLSRVERADPPLRFSRLNPVDAPNPRAGNRFDVPGAGVLYGATAAAGAYAETLAGFRRKASAQRTLTNLGLEPGRIAPGEVPAGWIATRRLRTFHVVGSLPFVDVEAPATHTFLTEHAPELLLQHDLENLDVAHVRGPNRLLTRTIAGWVYSRTDEHGGALYAGIRYVSRLGDFECWAVFDGARVELEATREIVPDDPALREVVDLYHLTFG
ncbi:RES domain-containing protein (plasmid) [Herbiconiux sp. KACC 21604]|uniref:RES domain-containing protein n=1 Tax=unclassified Herbiconiux TaxID=2618217 RepID=UPI0014915F38|nr:MULTISPECIES: RES domain-containing protein [unclassified Herbiconiux]QJU56271.1 RES domain-containing protein [Herbiconiux sp. SALV-R1]WPO88776.1 RES domain-containing protein [Herbiconiux sp. KACC 21604]